MEKLKIFLACFLFLTGNVLAQNKQSLRLWYKQPALAYVQDNKNGWKDDTEWLKALPLGNGNISAMIFGDVNEERIQLNEKTLWSGSPADNNNPAAIESLSTIRELLFAEKYREAEELTNKTQICKGVGSGEGNGANVPYGCFQTFGDLRLDFKNKSNWSDYHRELDLNTAVAKVTYLQNGVRYTREMFISSPANVFVMRISADKKGSISFSAMLSRPERFQLTSEENQLVMNIVMDNGKGREGMRGIGRLMARTKGGKQHITNNILSVEYADEAILFFTASTNYQLTYPVFSGREYIASTKSALSKAASRNFSELKKEHIADYQHLFLRNSFTISTVPDTVPTDIRIQRFKTNLSDNQLLQLYYQYGRYLLISSAREKTLPANLQGIWANKIQTPWNCDYHTNINVQMNYWPAEVTNLSELHTSLIDFIKMISQAGTQTAAVQYNAPGWCVHPIANVWGFTAPGEHPSWGLHLGAGAWLCQHVFEHYRYTQDKQYLKEVFPLLESAAHFYLHWLVNDKKTGKWVSGPASSPENEFITSEGVHGTVSMGPSHDQELIYELFTNLIKAADLLNNNSETVARVKEALPQLQLPQIGEDGRIMEWSQPFAEADPGHRHVSHLYGLYPGEQFNREQTPQFVEAAKKSLDYRLKNGGGYTGWSGAWTSNLWARLQEGNKALVAINNVLVKNTAPNLFDLHPPFQIDGNFGITAGMAEMILQSQGGVVVLLPALPSTWENGEMTGLCARGNFEINIRWKNHALDTAIIKSKSGGKLKLKYGDKIIETDTKIGQAYHLDNQFRIKN